jgi:hypothetical protein
MSRLRLVVLPSSERGVSLSVGVALMDAHDEVARFVPIAINAALPDHVDPKTLGTIVGRLFQEAHEKLLVLGPDGWSAP